ncbi:MAG: AI-2E family transporter, partial [Limnochordia bacterium]
MGRTFWFVLAAAGLLAFLYRVRIILTPFLFAVLIAYTLYPLVVAVERRGASRAVAILTVYLCLGIALGVIAWLVLPRFVAELEDLLVQLPARTRAWRQLGERARQLYQRLRLPELVGENDLVGVVVQRLEAAIENLAGRLMSLVMSAFTNIVSLIISPVLAFYFLRDHQSMRNRTLRYV